MISTARRGANPSFDMEETKAKTLTQEVRILVDVSVDLDARYTPSDVRDIVLRGARLLFRNNARTLNAVEFADEALIYSAESGRIQWTPIQFTSSSGVVLKPNRVLANAEDMRDSLEELVAQLTGPAQVYGDGCGSDGKKTGLSHWEFNALRDQRIAKAQAILAKVGAAEKSTPTCAVNSN